jgi:uncharacterized protein YgbK (DUF1537 family)
LIASLIADDLTGAADAAVAFSERGLRTHLLLDTHTSPPVDADVTAFSIESRDAPTEELPARNEILRSLLRQPGICLRKIDSIVRGNTLAEIALIARMGLDATILLAPAYPALGRCTISGELHWQDALHSGVVPLETPLRALGVSCIRFPPDTATRELASHLRTAASSPSTICLCDASSQVHLDAIVTAGIASESKLLWIGSAGLAFALSNQLPARVPEPRERASKGASVLFFIGSEHPVTRRQLEVLRAAEPPHVVIIPVPRGRTHSHEIRDAVARQPPGSIACVIMTGGDTAMFVCRALGVSSLRIKHEIAPGVPLASMQGGLLDGVDAVLKSGGFGETNLLHSIAQRYRTTADSIL